ncbi:MAG: DUF5668 domain-containing protein [Bryobacteraceae bacterium]
MEMNPEPKIVGYCRACGKALDESTVRNANGTIYCAEHVPSQVQWTAPAGPIIDATSQPPSPAQYTSAAFHAPHSPYAYTGSQPPPLPGTPAAGKNGSPALAFFLGMIPGVGAVYNGQYAKGLIHVIIVGALIGIIDSGEARSFEPLFGLLLAGFWFYMAFEAYHTAKRRNLGQPLVEFPGFGGHPEQPSRFPIGPVVLIGLGLLFLLNNLDLLDIRKAMKYWPAALIVYGAYMLWIRLMGASPSSANTSAGPAAPPSDSASATDTRSL